MRIGKLYTSLFTALKTAKSAAFVRTVLLAGVLLCGVQVSAQTYCTPGASVGCSQFDQYAAFSTSGGLTNINHTPGTTCEGDGAGNASFSGVGLSASASLGTTMGFSVTNNSTWEEHYAIWIDFNHDFVFQSSEAVLNTGGSTVGVGATTTGSFTVPIGATVGTTTLRIRCTFLNNAGDPCAVYSPEAGISFDFPFTVTGILYDNGSSQTLSQCENLGATSINSKLTASGGTGTDTWSVVTSPTHGTLGGLPTTAAAGTSVSPTGVTYTSNSNYVGTDVFVIQVQESGGSITALTTVNVTVTGPDVSSFTLSDPAFSCKGSGITGTVTSTTLVPGTYTITYATSGANSVSGTASLVMVSGSPNTGTFVTGNMTNTGSTTLAVSSITDGSCVASLSSSTTTTVTTPPTAYGVSIGNLGHYCSGGTGVPIGMAFSDIGINYQLFLSGTAESSPTAGLASSFSDFAAGPYTTAGTYNVVATNATTGCTSAMSNTVTVVIDPLPTQEPLIVSNSGHYCAGGSGVTVSVNPTVSGTTYQLYKGASTVGSSVSGTGSGVVLGTGITPVGVYSVVATTTATGCTSSGANSITVTTDPLPVAQTVTATGSVAGTGHYCAGGSGVVISVSTTQVGISYQLVLVGTGNIGTAIAGTGSAISYPAQTTAGTYNVVGTNTTTTCTNNMSNTETIVIDALPAAITGTPVVCVNQNVTLGDVTAGGIWTSNNTLVATVGSGSGIVTGVSGSFPTITFTVISSGCYVTQPVTVNPLPSAITGPTSVCVGLTTATALGSTPSGGVWSSSNTAIGTIGSTSGFAYGVAAGAIIITYTNTATTCYITGPFTVNPNPASITGVTSVCVGSSTSLNDGTSGGSWTSGNTFQATVVGSGGSGAVTGVSGPSTPIISYTLPTGCYAVVPVTVNPLPPAITSTSGFLYTCNGTSITLNDGSGPGTWVSGNTGVATIGASSGVVTTVAPGNSTITYSVTSTGCSTSSVLTVNALPSAISGTAAVCVGQNTTLTDGGGGTWASSDITTATVGSATGIVHGVAAGTVTIIYTLPSGCSTNITVTVNGLPATPGGANNVCVSSTATITDVTGGGTWSSSNTALATVNSTSGLVSGIAQGFPNMTYTITATGCYSTGAFTVNPLPTTITGTLSVCVASTTLLASSPGGGTWTSSDATKATVGSTTGLVTGVAFGNPTIVYTLPTGCTTSTMITVNPLPAGISGIPSVCTGSTTTLSDLTPSGTWSSSNTSLATVAGGVVSGVAVGVPVISYTLSATGCYSTLPVSVNQTPVAITGVTNTCIGTTTTLADATTGGSWSSSNPALGTVSSTGVVTGISNGSLNISYTTPAGCFVFTSYSVNPLPASITGTMNVCVASSTILADGTAGGSWTSSNTSEATVVTGTVTGVAAGTPTISYTLPSGCVATTTVTVNALPSAITGTAIVCTGNTTTLVSSPTTGLWSSGTPTQATVGSTTGVVTGVLAGNPVITYTLPTGCITTQTMTVNTTPVGISGTTAVCIGLNTTLTDATTGGTWSSSNTSQATVVGSTGTVTGVSSGIPIISYIMPTGCFAKIPVTVNPNPAAITGAAAVCTGSTIGLADATTGGLWSSSDATKASVGSTTGVVTGVSAGTPNITYTLITGCIATTPVSVNTTPGVITGPTNVCTTSNITLSNGTPGGSWVSSNTSEATITSGGGVVTGVASGTPTITYIMPSGCFVTYVITVNPTPAATTGTPAVCVTLTTTLSESLSGGLWSSSDITLATVGSNTGTVTGVASGFPNITYTMPTGCLVVTPITVNPIPAAVTGVTVVCAGSTTTLNDVTSGGVWSSGNTLVATVGGTTGVVTGVSAGATGITYTLGAGCFASTVVTVNPVPNISSFTSPTATAPCLGGSSVVTVNSTSLGAGTFTVTYNLSGANTATASSATLTMGTSAGTFTIPSTSLTATGSTTVTITSITNSFGCNSNPSSSNTATFPVNILPTVYNVLGGGGYCSGGTGVHIFLSNSVGGVNYQLYFGSTATGSPVAGTFSGLDFGSYTAVGTYTVNAVNATTGCTSNMSGSATVSVNPLPTQYAMTGGGAYCFGGSGVLVGLANSQAGKTYQLYNGATLVGTPVSGTGSAISFGLQTTAGSYTSVATDATTFCTNTMTGSSTVTVNPLPSAISGTMLVCVASTVTLSDIGGGTWSSSDVSKATIGSATGVVTGVAAGTPSIVYTLPTGCTTTSVITVNPLPSAIAGPTAVCATASISLTDPTGSGNWTSSNTSLATVGVSSGTVNGIAAGTPVITYSLPTGCFVTYPITVNATPTAITGIFNVCNGFSTLLSNTVSGGTWASSTPTVATVGSTTGLVNGVTTGTTTISYTLPGGCYVTTPFTVNPMPSAIAGATNVCVGSGATLTDVTTGGGWSSSNPSLATIISTTGAAAGISAGTLTMTYTLPAGCYVTAPFTVNVTPAAITGTNNVCQGLSTTLSDVTTGGSWTSSATGVATIGLSTGIVNGVSAGTSTISYTLPAGSCFTTFAMTVNSLPAAIAGVTNACVGSSSTLTDATTGGSWSSSNTSLATVGTGTGTVNGVAAGTPNITYTLPTGCIASTNFTVNPLPSAITGITTVCAGSSATLSDASTGGTWTSSNTSIATVGSTTGTITGVANGTTSIVYTLPTGCTTTIGVTVNPSPTAITGSPFVCTGSATTLADGVTGGTWTSSNTALASVVGSTGVVSGVAVGSPTITYTLPLGCNTTFLISVNPTPSAITGTLVVCSGLTTTLSDASGGGTWISGNTSAATIGSLTGVVNGVAAGNSIITYTLPGGCTTNAVVTVNTTPVAITGANNVCVGSAITLTDLTTGGAWTSSNTTQATIGGTTSTTVAVNGISAGTPFVTYTMPVTGCNVTYALTVNPLPASITGTTTVCVGASTTIADATTGGTWTSSNTVVALISASTGVISGVSPGVTTYTYTLPTGCIATISGNVNPLPTVFTLSGGGTYCFGGVGIDISLSGSLAGTNYQLKNGATTVATVAGPGIPIDFGFQTAGGTYTIVATTTANGCSVNMSGSAFVTVNPLPTAFNMTGGGAFCLGGAGVAIGLNNSTTGINYQFYRNGTVTGSVFAGSTGSSLSLGSAITSPGVYTVIATNALTACTMNMLGTAIVTVNPLPTAFTVSGGGSYCSGATGVHIGLSSSQTGVTYTLTGPATSSVLGSGSAIDFGAFTTAGTYTASAVNTTTSCANTMTGSANVTVNPLPTAFALSASATSYCVGTTGVTLNLSGSQSAFSYQLYLTSVSGTAAEGAPVVGTGSGILTFGLETGIGTYTAIAVNTTTGCTVNMTGAPAVTVNPLPVAYTVTGGGTYCTGGTGVNVGLSNSDALVTYKLYRTVGITTTLLTSTTTAGSVPVNFGLQTIAGTYTITATNAAGCVQNMLGSAIVNIAPLPNQYSMTGGGAYCAGSTGVPVGLATGDVGVSYQLYLNGTIPSGLPVAGAAAPVSFGIKTITGTYTVVATNTATLCTNNMLGSVLVTVNPLPTQFTVTGGGSYCAGGTGLHVFLSGSQSGISYQLYNGSATAGAAIIGAGTSIDFGLYVSSGTRTVIATNPITTCSVNMLGSALVVINPVPASFTVGGGGSYCAGATTGIPHITLGGSVAGINYQLYNGASPVGTAVAGSGGTIDFGAYTAVGTYSVNAMNATTGCTAPMTGSATISTIALPTLYTITGGGSYCTGGGGVAIGLSSSDTGVTYRLYNTGVAVGSAVAGTGSAISFGLHTSIGVRTVIATNSAGCSSTMTGSVTVSINPLPTVYPISGGGGYCPGGAGVLVGLTGSNTGVNYQLYNGTSPVGAAVPGTNIAISFGPQTGTGTYSVQAINAATTCTSTMTGTAVVSLNPLPTSYTVTGGGGYCVGGSGALVGLSSSSLTARYQLYLGTTPVGVTVAGSGTALNFGLRTATGVYSVVGIDNSTFCTSNMTGSVTVSLNPIPTAYNVTGGGSYCAGGAGLIVGTDGSDLALSYQLYKDGSALGAPLSGTGSALSFGTFTTAGNYTVVATNLATTCTGNMTGSVTIAINPLPLVYTVTGGGSYCAGGAGDSVAISSSDIGVNYQLYNGTAVGAAVGGTGSEINFGMETTAGTYTVVATDAVTGCSSNMSSLATVMINPLPNNTFSVTGGGSYCAGGAGEPVGLSNSNTGISYQLYDGTTASGFAVAGTGTSISFGIKTAAGIYTVVGTNSTTGCTSNMTGSETIIINPLPVVDTVTGGGNFCPGSAGLHIGLSNSSTGINYQLFRGSTTIAFPVAGTGSALDFGAQTITGTYFVTASDATTGCSINMTGSASIGVYTPPTAYLLSSSASSYCSGGAGVSVTLSGSNIGVTYQLYRGSTPVGVAMSGTGFALNYGLFTTAGTYSVMATSTSTGCSATMTGTPTIAVNPLPVVYTVSGGGSYCAGGTGIDVSLGGSDVGVNYQLYDGGTATGASVIGTGFSLDFGHQTAAGTYTVIASYSGTSCSTTMLSSAAITINSLPVAYLVDGGGSICSGGTGSHIGLSASDSGISYQLYNGTSATGTPIISGITGSPLDFGAQTIGGAYSVTATNPVTGCANNMIGSATVTVNALPVVFTISGGGNYCIGGTGVHVGLSGSAVGVSYELFIGGTTPVSTMSGTGSTLDFGLHTAAGTYTIVATNTSGCTSNMSGSVAINISPLPVVYAVTGGGTYCSVSAGASIGLSHSQSGVNYQLYTGSTAVGSVLGGTGSSLDFGLHPTGSYSVVAIDASTGCATDMTGTVTATPVAASVPSVAISTGFGDTVCAGTFVTYTASAVNGGSSATYQWYVNGSPVSTAGNTYGYTPINGNVVSVTMTSSLACVSPATANSAVTMVVRANLTPSVSITASTHDTICQGTSVNFTAIPVNGGTTPGYTWIVNGFTAAFGANYSYVPDNGDVIFCVMSSSYPCRLANTVLSNNIAFTVDSNITPAVTIHVNLGSTTGGVAYNDTLTAVVTNGASGVTYEWQINGNVVPGANSSVLMRTALNANDIVTCIASKTNACGILSGSNQVVITLANVGVATVNSANTDIQLVPNPNKGVFTVKGSIGTTADQQVTMEITDVIGQVIYTTKIIAHNGVINETVQLGNSLANGMYLLNLHSDAGNKVFHMVVEQ